MGTSAALPNSKTPTLAAVAELGEEAMALARPELDPREFVALLLDKALFPDAVRFVAHALPKREAVWWAWVSARRAGGDAPPPAIKAALDATEKWIAQPTDELRVLIATEVLSEGQNCQDANVVVNFDLPWAIIRLIQRAGRVDASNKPTINLIESIAIQLMRR